jgi:hypothetical protein
MPPACEHEGSLENPDTEEVVMRTRAFQSFMLATGLLVLGTGVRSQECSSGPTAREFTRRALADPQWRPGARVTPHVEARRYRGTYGRARDTRGRGCPPWRVLVPAHFERVAYQVFVRARIEKVWVPPAYETRHDFCGRPYQVLVRKGYFKTIRRPAHYETRTRKEWIAGNDVIACAPTPHRVAHSRDG